MRGAGRLLTMDGSVVSDGAVLVRDGTVRWTGPQAQLPAGLPELPELDAGGAAVLPGFVDPHTHLVWAGSRREELQARLAGVPYDGGGIRTTVAATRATPDAELAALTRERLLQMARNGTTTVEVKTGYGLSRDQELRLLDVIAAVSAAAPVRVQATYLGAHVVPAGADADDYVEEVVDTLPEAAAHGAAWCDVFCDRGAFDVRQARRILTAATAAGLGTRIHAEQLAATGAARLAAEVGCASADHLDKATAEDARALAAAGVVGVVLPSATLTVGSGDWGAARRLADAGVELALATDCNPGTSWCESMPYVVQLACLAMGLTVDQAWRAATVGAAKALRRRDLGRLGTGASGDLVVLDVEHEADGVGHLGVPVVARTVVAGIPLG